MPFLQSLFRNGKSTPTSQPPTPSLECDTPISTPKTQPPSSFKFAPSLASRSSQETLRSSAPRNIPSPSTKTRREQAALSASPARPPRPPAPLFTSLPPPVPPPKIPIPPAPAHGRQRSASSASIKLSASRSTPNRLGQSPNTHSVVRLQNADGSPSLRPTLSRSRSATLDIELSATQPSVVASTVTASPPTVKRRPTALKLRTSNLTPPHSPSPPRNASKPLVKPGNSAHPSTRTSNDASRTQSSIDTIENLGSDDSNHTIIPVRKHSLRRYGSAQPLSRANMASIKRLERRRSSSTGDACLGIAENAETIPIQAVEPMSTSGASTRLNTPSTLTPASLAPSSTITSAAPSTATPSCLRPFENVPLPWTAVSTKTLPATLGASVFQSLLDSTLQQTKSSPSTMLLPSTLKTSISENVRLRGELARLRDKYDTLTKHRDTLLSQIEGGLVKSNASVLLKVVNALGKATSRCDRIARQIYICNDQIRQIQIQAEQHTVGALKVAMSRIPSLNTYPTPLSSTTTTEIHHDTEAYDSEIVATIEPKIIITVDPTALKRNSQLTRADSRRTSTATIISVNHLGFPLPPDRLLAPERPGMAGRSNSSSHLEIRVDLPSEEEGFNEILIYPPGHRRSLSAPLLTSGLPHTPWRSSHDSQNSIHSASSVGDGRGTVRLGTAPLRVKTVRKRGFEKGVIKAKSLAAKRPVSSELKKRAKRGRESQLETPQSILLSLATAPLWMRKDVEGDGGVMTL